MPGCAADSVQWKNRRGYHLSNGAVEITVLTGGGHIADFRLCGHPINTLWEAPWQTIEPQTFSPREHTTVYGEGPVGKFLSGYTGHALSLGYFGMPSPSEAEKGLALHGEAGVAEWRVIAATADNDAATLVVDVPLPFYRLYFKREIVLLRETLVVSITETVANVGDEQVEFQWVQHAAFGGPFFTKDEATLFVSGTRGVTWPSGYENHELLENDFEYKWPYAKSVDGASIDLSQPFTRDGTGFVAALLANLDRENAFAVVYNRRHQLVAGYCFDHAAFPWIALWEENCARESVPWNKRTRVRGVEFGSSPMPLGLVHARNTKQLFGVPVLCSLHAGSRAQTQYDLFLHAVPSQWSSIKDVRRTETSLVVQGGSGKEIELRCGKFQPSSY